jgi:hypothetical protein
VFCEFILKSAEKEGAHVECLHQETCVSFLQAKVVTFLQTSIGAEAGPIFFQYVTKKMYILSMAKQHGRCRKVPILFMSIEADYARANVAEANASPDAARNPVGPTPNPRWSISKWAKRKKNF